jgi:ABC-type proline/glycine betaine transport system permease subunit
VKLERLANICFVLSIVVGVPLAILACTKGGPMWLLRPGVAVMFALSVPPMLDRLLVHLRGKPSKY